MVEECINITVSEEQLAVRLCRKVFFLRHTMYARPGTTSNLVSYLSLSVFNPMIQIHLICI